MLWKNLLFISVRDLFAKKGRLLLTMVGITVGVACLLFLLSLTTAIKKKVITEVLGTVPETELDVKSEEVTLLGFIRMPKEGAPVLDEKKVEEIKKTVPGIRAIYGTETIALPAEIKAAIELPESARKTLEMFGLQLKPFGTDCGVSGVPRELVADGLEHPEDYAFKKDNPFVPVVISTHLVDMYNISFATAMKMPRLDPKGLKRLNFELWIGESSMASSGRVIGPFPCKAVGLSRRAPIWSISVPPEYIGYWKKEYYREPKETVYQKVAIFAESVNLVEGMEKKLEEMGFEVTTNKETISKINTASAVINALVILVGLIILLISSASIINILTMSVYEEATDIAILRSVGARKAHVRGIYLLKAGFIGLVGALDGLLIGFIAIQIADNLAQKYLHALPYRPDTFFLPSFSLAGACFLVGFVFSLAAGTIPANIAASLNPSKVLREG